MNIITHPRAEWTVIESEPASVQGLFVGYAAILAAIPALARVVHDLMPHCFFAVCVTWNPVWVVVSGAIYYLVSLAGLFVIGLIIDMLAPSFGGQRSQVQAMKVAVYSWTAAWLAGAFIIIPWVGWLLSLAGLYSLYLLYTGLPAVMKSPADKSLGYSLVVVVLAIVVFIVIGVVAAPIAMIGAIGGGSVVGPAATTGTMRLGGAGSVDLGKLEASAKQAEQQLKASQSGGPGKVVAVDPARLQALLPSALGGLARSEVSSTSAGASGLGGSSAEATYESGDSHITLSITDLAAAGGFAAMADAFHVQSNRQTATGYEKVSTIGGRLTTEKYDNTDKSGEYVVIVGNRFSVSAEGSGVGMDALKGAVASVGPDRLQALAHG